MRSLELRAFQGRNVYIHRPAALALIDLEDLCGRESRELPGFNEHLLGLLPGLSRHSCASGRSGGFLERLQAGTYFGHVLEHVILELQARLGLQCSYGKTMSTDQSGVYEVIFECPALGIADQLVETGLDLVQGALEGASFNLTVRLNNLARRLAKTELGPSTRALADAAKARGISVSRIGSGSLLRLGTGCHAKRVQATLTSESSCIASDIAGDKSLTKLVLGQAGIPVPRGQKLSVDDVEQAISFWQRLARPVVVKPCDGNQGKGVSLNLDTPQDISEACAIAARYSSELLVEEYIAGHHYRLLVVGGQLVAASERIPAHVVGDGCSTIGELVEQVNQDPRRGAGHEKPLTRIAIDDVALAVLARQGLRPESVPAAAQTVWLRDNANLSTGGTAIDVTEWVHPDLAAIVVRAVRLVGLDVAGVDLVCDSIAESPDGGGAIIEINAAPGIRMHHYPVQGQKREVADAIISNLFPDAAKSEIPLVAVTGTNGKTTTSRLIAHVLRQCHGTVGLTSTEGIYLNERCIVHGDTTGPWSANVLLSDPAVEAAVLELARGGLLHGGLAYDQSDVAVLTNVSEDHLGQDNLSSLDDLVWVKSLVLEAVRPEGYAILNADDSSLQQLLPRLRCRSILFSLEESNPQVRRHLGAGGRAVFLHDGWICLAEGNTLEPLITVGEVPFTWGGHAKCNVANALAATGALWGMTVEPALIRTGLVSFQPSVHNPGRQTLTEVAGRPVMVDYAHNVAGLQQLSEFARHLCSGRLLGVIAAPGDRRSATVFRVGQAAGKGFDQLFIKEDLDRRGRAPGETAEILRQGAISTGMSPGAVGVYLEEMAALRAALLVAGSEDLIVVLYEKLELTFSLLEQLELQLGKSERQAFVVAGTCEST